MKLSKAIEYYLLTCKADGCRPRTIDTYRDRLRRLNTQLGQQPIQAITVMNLREYAASLYEEELSEHTVDGHIRTLHTMFSWAYEERIIEVNPAQRIKRPKLPKIQPKAIAVEDIQRMLDAAKALKCEWESKRNIAILKFLTDTGCRLQGLANLKVEELDFEAGLSTVYEKDRDWRFVFLKPPTIEAIKMWLEVRPYIVCDDSVQRLWIGKGGRPLAPRGIQSMFKRLKSKAGITGPANAHAFRHRFAISYLLNGGDLASLADILGHSDIRTTKKYYARFLIKELQKKHDRHSPIDQVH
jgi:site-specific recombinase XerD